MEQRGNENDRDAAVFDVYYANYQWAIGQREKAMSRLEKALQFLEGSEVFYEMHGRALLADFYQKIGNSEKAMAQIEYFNNPRSAYIAFETRCLMSCVKAKLLVGQGENGKAKAILRAYRDQAESIGARSLIKHIEATIDEMRY